jgi:HEAT repeat protein
MKEARRAKSTGRALDRLIDQLRESDDFTRAKIVEELVSSPSKELVERAVRLLNERSTSVRMDVLDILRKTGNYCIEAIIQLLYHPNEDMRVYGCEVLGFLKNTSSLPYLIEKAYEDNENVKNAAVMALGEFDDPRAIDVLLDVLQQEEWVAFSAICSLQKIGNKRSVPALLSVFKGRGEELSLAACEALMSFQDSRIIEEIVGFVTSLEEEKKGIFIRVIIEQGDGRVFQELLVKMGKDLLCHLLNYLKVEKRKSLKVVDFLAHFRQPASAGAMLDIMKDMDPDGEDYERVLRPFAELKDVWGQHLEEYLTIEEYALPVIRACGEADLTVNGRLLLKVFSSSPLQIKREIMKQLGKISNGKGYSIIREAMRDADGHVQAEAVAIAGTMSIIELTPDVLLLAQKGYADVRAKALLALLRLDPGAALKAIEAFVNNGSAEDKRIYLSVAPHLDGKTNFPFLEKLLGDRDEQVRQMAIRATGNLVEDESYLNLFSAVLQSGDIPNEVLKVIGEKKLTGFKKLLVEIFLDPLQSLWTKYHALGALGGFGDRSLFPLFVGGLKEREHLIKIGSLKALAELNDKRAIPHIRPFMKSIDEDLKTAAQMALGRLSRSERAS